MVPRSTSRKRQYEPLIPVDITTDVEAVAAPSRRAQEADAGNCPGDEIRVADLALSLVLNEICVEARLATNSAGAIVALKRDGGLSCRARAGATADAVAEYLNGKSGIVPLCVRTGQPQRCDDAAADERIDPQASRRLGFQSLLLTPITRTEEVVGVLEVFAAQPNAFSEKDALTLQALARRVVNNLDLAEQWLESGASVSAPSSGTVVPPRSTSFWPGHGDSSPRWTTLLYVITLTLALVIGWMAGSVQGRRIGLRDTKPAPTATGAPAVNHATEPATAQVEGVANESVSKSQVADSEEVAPGKKEVSSTKEGPVGSITNSARPLKPEVKNGSRAEDSPLSDKDGVVLFQDKSSAERRPLPKQEAKASQTSSVMFPANSRPRRGSSAAADAVRIGPDAASERLIRRVEPDYPEAALERRIQGRVVLDVVVSETGAVQDVRRLSGNPQLASAASHAIQQWQFKALTQNGKPTKFVSTVVVNFVLP